MTETPKIKAPDESERQWFKDNVENIDFYSATINDLEKYYILGTYFKKYPYSIFGTNGTKHDQTKTILDNMNIISQILNTRSSEKSEKISRNSLVVSVVSIFIAIVTLCFAVGACYLSWQDYHGDKEWQRQQICELKKIAKSELPKECK